MKVVLGAALLICSQGVVASDPIFRAESFLLDKNEVAQFQRDALLGSAESAKRLYQYYLHVNVDEESMRYWLQVCAENGDPVCEYNQGFFLSRGRNEHDFLRAKFWLERAEKDGSSLATSLLQELRSHKKIP